MSSAAPLATHVVRAHRHLRQSLPSLLEWSSAAATSLEAAQARAAGRAARFLDEQVLAHAQVEDAVVDEVLHRGAPVVVARRLHPQHDTLRRIDERLHAYVDQPRGDVDVAGWLVGLHRLLSVHLEEEWRTLLPLLSRLETAPAQGRAQLDEARGRTAAGDLAARVTARLFIPAPLATVVEDLSGPGVDVGPRLATAAADAVARAATSTAVDVRADLVVRVALRRVLATQELALYVGQLHSNERQTVVAPVEFELIAIPVGDMATELVLDHSFTPRRALSRDVPAHRITSSAMHALLGECAALVGRPSTRGSRERVVSA